MSEVFEGTIKDLSGKSLGVVDHPSGRVFFVPGTLPGDVGRFRVTSTQKRYGFAQVEELVALSPDRIAPPCPHQGYKLGKCGGCPLMIADYGAQLKYKQKMVLNMLERFALIRSQTEVGEIIGSEDILGYRNRAQFKTDGDVIGFVAPETNSIVPINDCLVLTEKNRRTLKALSASLPRKDWRPRAADDWNIIEIDETITPDEVVKNQRRSFKQANDKQNLRMKRWLKQSLQQLDKSKKVMELFAGSGNFTEVIAELGFESIIAVEFMGEAVRNLAERALDNVVAESCDLFRPSGWIKLKNLCHDSRILVLDPPRRGFQQLASFMENFPNLESVFYISCDVNTFCRDVKKIEQQGWQLQQVQPIDQFPHTPHVELLTRLVRM